VEGFIGQGLVDEGAHVRKGRLLFRVNSDEADQYGLSSLSMRKLP
jgi:multidrug efflux pump subunit AcrA (membrane-fusion protein)